MFTDPRAWPAQGGLLVVQCEVLCVQLLLHSLQSLPDTMEGVAVRQFTARGSARHLRSASAPLGLFYLLQAAGGDAAAWLRGLLFALGEFLPQSRRGFLGHEPSGDGLNQQCLGLQQLAVGNQRLDVKRVLAWIERTPEV